MLALVSPESEDTGLPKNRKVAPEKAEWNEKPVFRVKNGVSVGDAGATYRLISREDSFG